VFILEHGITPKPFADVRKASRNAYPGNEVPSKTTVQQSGKKIRDTECICVSSKR